MGKVGSAIGGIFRSILGGGQAQPPKPPKPPAPMPVPDDQAILNDQIRQMQLRQAASGRQSTILSSGSTDKLGG